MRTCPECGTENADGADACTDCGTVLEPPAGGPAELFAEAGFDQEEQRERFERRFGIDIGDRDVDEFLDYLDRQDYSLTAWFWVIVAAQVLGVALFFLSQTRPGLFAVAGLDMSLTFVAVSGVIGLSVLADTRAVGQFDTWSRIRWTYVLLSSIPLVGHIAGAFYVLLRRLMRERTQKHRRRLVSAGFDVDVSPER
jgi:hypothetical protein